MKKLLVLGLALFLASSAALAQGVGPATVNIPDGNDVAQGAKADAVCGTATGTCTEMALLKYLNTQVSGPVGPAFVPVAPSTAAESGHILKASAGTLFGLCVNTGGASGWVLIFNSATVPGAGAMTAGIASGNLQDWFQASGTSTVCKSYGSGPGTAYSTGISVAFSTTGPPTSFSSTYSATVTFSDIRVQ